MCIRDRNEVGGLEEMAKINHAKAKVLYDYLDGQDFDNNPVQPEYRLSLIHICMSRCFRQ